MPEVAQLVATVTADTRDVESGLARVDRQLGQVGQAASRAGGQAAGFGTSMGQVGGVVGGVATKLALAGTAVTALGVAGFGAGIKASAEFSHGMSEVGAATQATGAELAQLRALSLSLGKDMDLAGVDATDAARAIAELGRGGVSTGDLLSGAAKGGLLLFSAGADSVEQAAGIAVKGMATFGLAGENVAHIADLVAAGANKSATSVGQLGMAFNQSAAVAANAGLSIEELTGTLSFLAQRGLEGSDAGTSLKTALQRLQAPTDVAAKAMADLGINVRDSNGHMLPFAQIADILKERLGGLSDAQRDAALQTIFGADAIRVAIPLVQEGGNAIREWTAKVDDAGYAARVGKQRNDDLFGSFEQLKATIQTGAIEALGRFEPALRKVTDAGTDLINDVLNNPQVQAGLDRLGVEGAQKVDQLLAKVKDPAFQQNVREWGTAALATGRAVASLAGDVRDTLGPPLLAAVHWFNDLDENGKKNVITFGLVAGAALAFRDELKTLLSVGDSVIDMFKRKTAAKGLLTEANKRLAGSAGETASKMTLVRGAATVAGQAIAYGAVVTLGAATAWYGIIKAADAYNDATGTTARNVAVLNDRMTLSNFAIAHGDTVTRQAAAGFIQYVEAQRLTIRTQDDLAAAWNGYLGMLQTTGLGIEGLTRAQTGQAQAQQAMNRFLGEGLIAGQVFNTTIAGMAVAANTLAATLPPVGAGMGQAAAAAGQLAVPVQQSALALADLNLYGTPAQARLNELASGALALRLQAAGLGEEYGRLATTFDLNTQAMQGVGGQSSMLGGYLGTLQAEWDALDEAVKRQGFTTDAQQKRYETLAPLIQFLNAKQGEYKQTTIDLTARQVELLLKMDSLNRVVSEGGAKAQGASAAVGILNSALGGQKKAADDGAAAAQGHAGALGETTAAAIVAKGAIAGVGLAILAVPKSFTVTAHVDISGALAAIAELNAHLPHSPAEKGPFARLPNWGALFDGFAAATGGALGLIDRFGQQVQASLGKFFGGAVVGTGGGIGAALAGVFDFAPAATAWEHRALPQARTLATVSEQIAERVRYGLDIAIGLNETIADTLPSGTVFNTGGGIGGALAGVFDLAPAVMTWQGEALPQAEILRDAGRRIAETLAGGLTVFHGLERYLDTPQRVLGELYAGFEAVLDYGQQSVFAADALKEQATAFATAMQEAARLFTQGQAFGQTIGRVQGGAFPLPAGEIFPQFPGLTIPKLAEGGIVTRPTLALVGERGPEAVIPLARMGPGGGGGGGGHVVHLSVNYYDQSLQGTDRARLAEFARDLKGELDRLVG